jgi:hypothetical protein
LRAVCSSLYVVDRVDYNLLMIDPTFNPMVCRLVCKTYLQGGLVGIDVHKLNSSNAIFFLER